MAFPPVLICTSNPVATLPLEVDAPVFLSLVRSLTICCLFLCLTPAVLKPFPQMPALRISMLPAELLSAIFEVSAEVPFHPLNFQRSRQSAFQDIISVSHVNLLFREISTKNPRLWANFPSLNIASEDFLASILERSSPLPFCLSYIEEANGLPINAWLVATRHTSRLKGFCVEIPGGVTANGIFAKSFLSLTLSQIERCIVVFQGFQNVRLFDPTDFPNAVAPHLKNLYLTNCHISPQSNVFNHGQIASVGITYLAGLTGPDAPASILLTDCRLWSAQFASLKNLVLWNCVSGPLLEEPTTNRLHLPLLETLAVGAKFSVAARIASYLSLPPQCLRTINFLFPGTVCTEDAQVAASAMPTFLTKEEVFQECHLSFDRLAPTVQCVRGKAMVFFRFHLNNVRTNIDPNIPSVFNSPCAINTVTPVDIWNLALWEAVSSQLPTFTKSVWDLKVRFPPNNPFGPFILPSVIPAIPNISSLGFQFPKVYATHSTVTRELVLTKLEKLTLRLADGDWTDAFKAGVVHFLQRRIATGSPLREVLLVMNHGLCRALGADGIRVMLAEVSEMLPAAVTVKWVEK